MNDRSKQPLDAQTQSRSQTFSSYIYCNCQNGSATGSVICPQCGKKKIGAVSDDSNKESYNFSQSAGFTRFVKKIDNLF